MSEGLSNGGEERYNKSGIDGMGLRLGLYDDALDNVADGDSNAALSDNASGVVSTEPTDGSYSVVEYTVSDADGDIVSDPNNNWGYNFTITFDVSNTTGSIDAVVLVDEQGTDSDTADDTIFARHHLDDGSVTLDDIDTLDVTVEGYLD